MLRTKHLQKKKIKNGQVIKQNQYQLKINT